MKIAKTGKMLATVALAVTGIGLGGSAMASHAWGTYAWSFSGGELTMPVVYNTDASWRSHVSTAVSDWNASTVIQAPIELGSNTACNMASGTIQVCNANYGSTGWLGIATISLSSGKIVAGSTKLNDYYFNLQQYDSYSWRQLVTCQEIGHDYGLAHQNENFSTDETTSCMEYTSWPSGNEGPDQHDMDMLLQIYTGSGGGDTGGDGGGPKPGKGGGKGGDNGGGNGKGKNRVSLPNVGNTPDTWGRPIHRLPNGVADKFEREINGVKFITHVTWTREYLEEHGHGGSGHEH